MPNSNTTHEVLTAVFQVRHFPDHITAGQGGDARHAGELAVLLWQRALDPQAGAWSLPGGLLREDEDLTTSARRQLAEKVDVQEVSHLEQLSVFSDPHRVPGPRTIASTFLGLVPLPADPQLPPDTAWHPVSALPETAFDHGTVVRHARTRLAAKLSYTNIAFGLAPDEFSMSTLREIYCAALGYQVDATNLQRVLGRRGVLTPPGTRRRRAAPVGARPRSTGSPTPRCG